jgi:5-methylcytosine-specific restriction endonuclease McrA
MKLCIYCKSRNIPYILGNSTNKLSVLKDCKRCDVLNIKTSKRTELGHFGVSKRNRYSTTKDLAYITYLKIMYLIAHQKSVTIDHIIPLKHPLVCGLHTPINLQFLTKEENSRKHNKFDGTYENNSWRNDK